MMRRIEIWALLTLFSAGCRSPGPTASNWAPIVVWQGNAKVQSVAVGDVEPARPGLEAIGTDAGGRVVLVPTKPTADSAQVIHDHGTKLTGIFIGDVDPSIPGSEVYVGGYCSGETGGAVVQLVVRDGQAHARRILEVDGFVHGLAHLAGGEGEPGALVITSYTGGVWLAEPGRGKMAWPLRLIHREPDDGDPEHRKIKDVVAGRICGISRRIFLAVKSGRGVLLTQGGANWIAKVIHEEPDGIARLALDGDGSLWLAGNRGRVVRLGSTDGAWHATPIHHEKAPLRGIAHGAFPAGSGTAHLALYGYSKRCRLLASGRGGWQAVTLFEDVDLGHYLAAGDLFPKRNGDELVLAGYSGRIVVLVPPEDG